MSNQTMTVSVRINGLLARQIGTTRLRVQVDSPATVQAVLTKLTQQYPTSADILKLVIPFVAGRHLNSDDTIQAGQEIALLIPVAGG